MTESLATVPVDFLCLALFLVSANRNGEIKRGISAKKYGKAAFAVSAFLLFVLSAAVILSLTSDNEAAPEIVFGIPLFWLIAFIGVEDLFSLKIGLIPCALIFALFPAEIIYASLTGNDVFSIVYDGILGGVVAASASGSAFLLFRGGIGKGDVLLLSCIGFALGLKRGTAVIFAAMVISFVFGCAVLIFRRGNLRTRLPLAPFVFAGYVTAGITVCVKEWLIT